MFKNRSIWIGFLDGRYSVIKLFVINSGCVIVFIVRLENVRL